MGRWGVLCRSMKVIQGKLHFRDDRRLHLVKINPLEMYVPSSSKIFRNFHENSDKLDQIHRWEVYPLLRRLWDLRIHGFQVKKLHQVTRRPNTSDSHYTFHAWYQIHRQISNSQNASTFAQAYIKILCPYYNVPCMLMCKYMYCMYRSEHELPLGGNFWGLMTFRHLFES